MRLLHFDETDLAQNQQGILSAGQQRRLRARFQRGKRAVRGTIAAFGGVAFLLAMLPQFPLICAGYAGVGVAFWLGIERLLNWDENRALTEVEVGYVGSKEGFPQRSTEHRARWDPDARGSLTHIQHYIVIEGVQFPVPRRVQEAFQEYLPYRVYYLPESHVIVSAEALPPGSITPNFSFPAFPPFPS